MKAPTAKGAVSRGEGLEKMKKQPRHLIFLLKSNRLGLPMEGGSDPVCKADSPKRALATEDGEAPVKGLGCLLVFSLFISFTHSLIRSFTCDL